MADVDAKIAARDGGEVFPTLPIGQDSAPARQPRLRLRQLTDDEFNDAAAALETFAEDMASKIEDTDSWTSGEGYMGAIPGRLRELLQPYAMQPPRSRPPAPPATPATRNQREHRLDEALDDLEVTQQATPDNRTAEFARDETKCVARILRTASVETAVEEPPKTCSIPASALHEHFTAVNTPRINFLPGKACGEQFRATMADIGAPTERRDAFSAKLTVDEVEDQLVQAAANSSPGHDGVGYDVYKKFAAQLVPLLHAAFQF
ncbi:hypothetical protein PR003_g9198 [Phytophthora rubi]|uniref:Uncharacterized protein n=1 Tax=Phytophthora rubi TaxID=129364 RepID=A0A6A4FIS4_9STRA|nr:hypothetical protein PR003_g9198 [Phytophthora rubi]